MSNTPTCAPSKSQISILALHEPSCNRPVNICLTQHYRTPATSYKSRTVHPNAIKLLGSHKADGVIVVSTFLSVLFYPVRQLGFQHRLSRCGGQFVIINVLLRDDERS